MKTPKEIREMIAAVRRIGNAEADQVFVFTGGQLADAFDVALSWAVGDADAKQAEFMEFTLKRAAGLDPARN